ncbi:hypothetical protein AGMMS50276_07340 [Synergistales bacterium]|nr:hypothetical protein AGMMS50276_07340 [Synergistales bacterium]
MRKNKNSWHTGGLQFLNMAYNWFYFHNFLEGVGSNGIVVEVFYSD